MDSVHKICHITSVHSRKDIRIIEKECVSLSKDGYDVYEVVNDNEKDEVYKNIHIISTGHKSANRYERIFYSVKWVLEKALDIDAEIYHLHDPELLQLVKPLKKAGKKVIFDSHEDTELQIIDKNWIPILLRKPLARVYGIFSMKTMRYVDGIVTVTPALVKKYKKYNPNIVMVTNYPIISENESYEEDAYGISDDRYVFFAGGISEQWCHEKVAEAISKVSGVKYLIAGKGNSTYIESVLKKGKGLVKYEGIIPHDDVKRKYKNAIAGMAVLEATQVGEEGSLGNTKLFEIMQAGKPVICSNLRLWREIVIDNKCGLCVDSKSVESIAAAIRYIIENPEKAWGMGENGKRAVEEKYNWNCESRKLLDFYKTLIEKTGNMREY